MTGRSPRILIVVLAAVAAWPGLEAEASSGSPCPADIDGDGVVGTNDLLTLIAEWGSEPSPADIDGDGEVGVSDLVILLTHWGPCPPPPSGQPDFDELIAVDVSHDAGCNGGLGVYDIYATGVDVTTDSKLLAASAAVSASNTELVISADDVHTPPDDPGACHTFVTFNRETSVDDTTMVAPDFELTDFFHVGTWFPVPDSSQGQALDISGATGVSGQFGVHIARKVARRPPAGQTGFIGGSLDLYTWGGTPHGVNVPVSLTIEGAAPSGAMLELDIKPGSCPTTFNSSSQGVIPVAVIGSASGVDPAAVDVSSLMLQRTDGIGGGVAPVSWSFEDVASPALQVPGVPCDCNDAVPDGFDDLTLKFDSRAVINELRLDDPISGDEFIELEITGNVNGTSFSASDCIRLVPPR